MTVLIRNGVVLARDGLIAADVLSSRGVIERIEPDIGPDGHTTIDASGCLVGPGLVDIHAHLREPGQTWKEDLETGSRSAAAGGYTAVVVMPNTEPPIDNAAMVADIRARADEIGLIEMGVAASVTEGRAGRELSDLEALYRAGARLFTDDGDCVQDGEVLEEAMHLVARLPGAVLAQHAEDSVRARGGHMHDGEVSNRLGVPGIPAEAEEAVVRRDLELVRRTGARYHCQHVSSGGTVELIRMAKEAGLEVTAEVTPHHLSFDESHLEGLDPNLKMYPPLRTLDDRLALRSALIDGTIDVVATDHAPHSAEEKAVGFFDAPRGVVGLETAASVAWEAVGDPDRFFECMSIRPARIAGLESQGHRLTAGAPANLVVFDPAARWVAGRLFSKSANSPYLGMEMTGRVVSTIHRGQVVHHWEKAHA